ncbi:MAG: insulinase family protein [Candidatus Portnoybacteria bacterium]|nr:insulinase family protein [Candidatus Portnoybacteria bacterium]
MWDPYAEFTKETLPNGLTIYHTKWNRPWIHVGFLIHCGAREDPKNKEGMAHFIEHVINENAANFSHNQIKKIFESFGGRTDFGRTGYLSTKYSSFIPLKHENIKKSFEFFGSMLLTANIVKRIEEERKIVFREIKESYPIPIIEELETRRRKALFSNHNLFRFNSPLGTDKSISAITKNNLQEFYDQYYTPANMAIVCIGGISLKKLITYLQQSPFWVNKPGKRNIIPPPVSFIDQPKENRYAYNVSDYYSGPTLEYGSYQSFAALPGNLLTESVKIANCMLDDILSERIRERKNWSYSFESDRNSYQDIWEFSITGQISTNALDYIEEEVEKCINTAQKDKSLFKHNRELILIHYKTIDISGKRLCNNALADLNHEQRIISARETIEDCKRITMDNVREVFSYLKPERRWTSLSYP